MQLQTTRRTLFIILKIHMSTQSLKNNITYKIFQGHFHLRPKYQDTKLKACMAEPDSPSNLHHVFTSSLHNDCAHLIHFKLCRIMDKLTGPHPYLYLHPQITEWRVIYNITTVVSIRIRTHISIRTFTGGGTIFLGMQINLRTRKLGHK